MQPLTLYHGGLPPTATLDHIDVNRPGTQQDKGGRGYGGFYLTDQTSRQWSADYAQQRGQALHAFDISPNARIGDLGSRNIDRLSPQERQQLAMQHDVVKGKDTLGRNQYVLLNKGAVQNMRLAKTAHTLEWTPGSYGKGLYYPNHDHLRTWNTDMGSVNVNGEEIADGEPSHSAMTDHTRGRGIPLLIHPEGYVRAHNYPGAEQAVDKAAALIGGIPEHMRDDYGQGYFRLPEDDWDFPTAHTADSQIDPYDYAALNHAAQVTGGTLRGHFIEYPDGGWVNLWVHTAEDGALIISDIQAEPEGGGNGSRVVKALQQFAQQSGRQVRLINVTNPGYWEHMGIQARTAKPKAKKGEDVRALPQKCKECKRPAIKSLVWAEGMAYVPTCAEHDQVLRKHLIDEDGEGAFQEVAIRESGAHNAAAHSTGESNGHGDHIQDSGPQATEPIADLTWALDDDDAVDAGQATDGHRSSGGDNGHARSDRLVRALHGDRADDVESGRVAAESVRSDREASQSVRLRPGKTWDLEGFDPSALAADWQVIDKHDQGQAESARKAALILGPDEHSHREFEGYHVAPRSARQQIMLNGLEARHPADNPAWDEAQRDWSRERQPAGVYVWTDLDDAQAAQQGWSEQRGEPYDMWKVKVGPGHTHDPDQMAARVIPQSILPHHLTLLTHEPNMTLEPATPATSNLEATPGLAVATVRPLPSPPDSGVHEAPAAKELARFLSTHTGTERPTDSERDLGPASYSFQLREDESEGWDAVAQRGRYVKPLLTTTQLAHTHTPVKASAGQGAGSPASTNRPSLQRGLPYEGKGEAIDSAVDGPQTTYQYSGLKGTQGALDGAGPVAVHEVNEAGKEDWEGRGRPVLYHHPHALYVGPNDGAHSPLYDAMHAADLDWDPSHVHEGLVTPKGLELFNDNEPDQALTERAAAALGVKPHTPEEPWSFPTAAVKESQGIPAGLGPGLPADAIEIPATDPHHTNGEDWRAVIHHKSLGKTWVGGPGSLHTQLIKAVPELNYNPYGKSHTPDIFQGTFVPAESKVYWQGMPGADWDFPTASSNRGPTGSQKAAGPLDSFDWDAFDKVNNLSEKYPAPEFVQVGKENLSPYDDSWNSEARGARWPWVWFPQTNKVHVGPEGSVHGNIDPEHQGKAGIFWHHAEHGPTVRPFDRVPPEVMEHIENHFHGKQSEEDDPFGFNFSKTASLPQVVDWRHLGTPDEGGHGTDDHPWLWDQSRNVVHVGPEDWFHDQLVHFMEKEGHDPWNEKGWAMGRTGYEELRRRPVNEVLRAHGIPFGGPGEDFDFPTAKVAAHTDDVFTCSSCGSHALTEPTKLGNGWVQTCMNCKRTRMVNPNHPLIQSLQVMQPAYPMLLNEVGSQRPMNYFGAVQLHENDHEPDEFWKTVPVVSQGFIYEPSADTLHVGAHDEVHHNTMWDRIQSPKWDNWPGFISHDKRGYEVWDEDQMPPEYKMRLLHHLREHLGYEPGNLNEIEAADPVGFHFPTAKTAITNRTDNPGPWKPGGWGKGLALPNGELHTWPVSSESPNGARGYHHSEYWRNVLKRPHEAFFDLYNYDLPPEQRMQLLHIDPNGRVRNTGSGDITHDHIYQGTGLTPEKWLPEKNRSTWGLGDYTEEDWNFPTAKVAFPAHIDPLNIVDHSHHEPSFRGFEGRKPMLYDPFTHTLHVGGDGMVHYELANHATGQTLQNGDNVVPQGWVEGWHGPNIERESGGDPYWEDEGKPNEIGWYNPIHYQVHNQVKEHFNAQDASDRDPFGFNFEAGISGAASEAPEDPSDSAVIQDPVENQAERDDSDDKVAYGVSAHASSVAGTNIEGEFGLATDIPPIVEAQSSEKGVRVLRDDEGRIAALQSSSSARRLIVERDSDGRISEIKEV